MYAAILHQTHIDRFESEAQVVRLTFLSACPLFPTVSPRTNPVPVGGRREDTSCLGNANPVYPRQRSVSRSRPQGVGQPCYMTLGTLVTMFLGLAVRQDPGRHVRCFPERDEAVPRPYINIQEFMFYRTIVSQNRGVSSDQLITCICFF